jgi:hypothetical protein
LVSALAFDAGAATDQQRPRPPMKALVTSAWGQLLLTLDGSIMSASIARTTRTPAP